MKSYWLWILLNMVVWPFAIVYLNLPINQLPVYIFGVAFYFLLFFLVPLIEKKSIVLLFILGINTVISAATLFPYKDQLNPFLILILSLLIAEGFYLLPLRYSIVNGAIGAFTLGFTTLHSNPGWFLQIFITVYILFLLIALIHYKKNKDHLKDLEARHEAIFSEFRDLKRRAVSEEELARQEERVLIAHEIHDSVGHKLTALIMQLEIFRLQTSRNEQERVESLKELANESLNETRRAVKSLKANDTGGLPGILRLIRRLELENMMHIHFSVKYGAFSAPLTGEQSFVIYRSVQEALTNIMKHSDAKEAEITFEAPGGSIFRFEIRNPSTGTDSYHEGFGLSQMRERLEKHNGGLKVYKTEGNFIVTGFIKIKLG